MNNFKKIFKLIEDRGITQTDFLLNAGLLVGYLTTAMKRQTDISVKC